MKKNEMKNKFFIFLFFMILLILISTVLADTISLFPDNSTIKLGEEVVLYAVNCPEYYTVRDNATFEWDYGDGFVTNEDKNTAATTHIYSLPGNYTITLDIYMCNRTICDPSIDSQKSFYNSYQRNITVVGTLQSPVAPLVSTSPIFELNFNNATLNYTGENVVVSLMRNGSAVSPIASDFVSGITGKALDISNSTGNYIKIQNLSKVLNGSAQVTISFWIKKQSLNSIDGLNSSSNSYIMYQTSSFNVRYGSKRDAYAILITSDGSSSETILNEATNKYYWQHYVISYNGSLMKLYIDGEETAGDAQSGYVTSSSSNSLYIGTSSDSVLEYYPASGNARFNGYIDDFKIYNTSFTKEQLFAGFELWHAEFHAHSSQYVHAKIPNLFTFNSTNKINASISNGSGYVKYLSLNNRSDVITLINKNGFDTLNGTEIILFNQYLLPALYSGTYNFSVQIFDSNGNVLGTRSERITKNYSGYPSTGINENNAILINGTTFYPILAPGITDLNSIKMLSQWTSHSTYNTTGQKWEKPVINVAHFVGWNNSGDVYPAINFTNLLDEAYTNNVKAMGPRVLGNASLDYNHDITDSINIVNSVKNKSALLMYSWYDEPDIYAIPVQFVRAMTKISHLNDMQHPVFVNLRGKSFVTGDTAFNVDTVQGYNAPYNSLVFGKNTEPLFGISSADVISSDYYPIEWGEPDDWDATVVDSISGINNMKAYSGNFIPTSNYVETTDIYESPYPTPWNPTTSQLKMLAWLQVVHNMNMISWFPYHSTTPDANFIVMGNFVNDTTYFKSVLSQVKSQKNSSVNINTSGISPWASGTSYSIGNLVMNNGTIYVSRIAHVANSTSEPKDENTALDGWVNWWKVETRVDVMIKEYENLTYIFTVRPTELNASGASIGQNRSVNLTVTGISAGTNVTVYNENRNLTVGTGGIITDYFAQNDVHIYILNDTNLTADSTANNTFYVSVLGAGNHNGSSISNSLNITEAQASASPGDIFLLQPGNYGNVTISNGFGTAENYVTYKRDPATTISLLASNWYWNESKVIRPTSNNSNQTVVFDYLSISSRESGGVSLGHYINLEGINIVCTMKNRDGITIGQYVSYLNIKNFSIFGWQDYQNIDFVTMGNLTQAGISIYNYGVPTDIHHILVDSSYFEKLRIGVQMYGITGRDIIFNNSHFYWMENGAFSLINNNSVNSSIFIENNHLHAGYGISDGSDRGDWQVSSVGLQRNTFYYSGTDPTYYGYVGVSLSNNESVEEIRNVSSFNAATNEVIVDINFSVDIAAGDNVLFYDGDHGSGIAFSGHYITVRGNIIHDIGNSGVLYSYDFTPSGGARVNRAHDILIEKNLIYDPPSYDMAVIDFGGSTTYDVGGNISILYNTIIGQVGKDNAGGPQTSEVPNAKWNYGSAINMELNPVADLSTINITGNLFIGVSEVNGTNIYNNLIYFSNGVFETDAVGPNRDNVIYGGYNNGSYVWDQGYLFEFNSSWFADGSNFNKTFDVGNHGYTFYSEFGIRNESDACSSGIITHGNFVGQACTNAANITADSVYPQFSSYWDNNASLIDSGIGRFNVTLANTNGTVILTFNNQNYTASNVSGSATRFNVSIASLTSGTYTYNWSSYGNGTSHNYNISNVKTYTVNSSDTSYPIFSTYWDNNGTLTGSGIGRFNVTLANTNGTVLLEINGVNTTAKNNSGSATRFNVSYSFSSSGTYVYKWHSWGNGTSINYNVSNIRNYTVNATPDTTFPSIVITYPSNNSNTTNTQINVNYTRSDNIAIGSCWYSNTSGAVNYTLLNCANMTGVTWLQGINNITIWVNDTAGNQNNSKITFTVDTIAPSINIVTPTNNSNSTNVNLDVNYTASDNIALSLCWYSNDTYSVNTTIACGTNITTITWTQGKHNVTVWTNDTLNNKNSSRVSFTVDSVAPYFTTFANQTLTSSQSLSYDINAVDAVIGLGTFKINSTSIFSIVSSTGILTNTSSLSAGNYYINVSVNDTLGNTNSSIIWINVSSDVTAPIVSLVSPTSWTSSSTVTFTYNVTDASSISNCSLIITNGTVDQTTTSITRNISQTFTKSLSNANYNWSVNCTDISNNVGNSSTLSLTVSYTETVPTSTGGGGGSGGSSTVISPTTNTTSNATIIPIEGEFILGSITKIIPFITLSQAGSLTNNNITFAINEMNIQVNEETNNVELTIIRYGAKPLNVTKPTNSKIYQYLEINSKNLNSLENITINFRADKDWASLNEIEKENVALFHFNEDASKWEEVPTVYSSENENYYYYNATISSLSYFYIGESSTTIKVVTTFLNLLSTVFIFVKTNILWVIIGIILMIIMFILIKLIPYAVKKAKEKKKESKIKERIDLIKQQSISPIAKPIIEHKEILQEKPIVKPKQIIQPKIPVKSEPKLIERKEIIKPREEIPKRIISSTERINIEKDRLRNEIANLRKEITSHEKLADKKSKK